MRIQIISRNSATILALCFNSHGYHTYGQQNKVNLIINIFGFSVLDLLLEQKKHDSYVYIYSGTLVMQTHVNPDWVKHHQKKKKNQISAANTHKCNVLFYSLADKINSLEKLYIC
jgi:hypothetical protein